MFQTLETDHQKNQDPLVGVLSQMLSGRSFEIITSAAASMGELKNFTLKLIRSGTAPLLPFLLMLATAHSSDVLFYSSDVLFYLL